MTVTVAFERIGCNDLPLPAPAMPGDAGMDLRAARGGAIGPGSRCLVGTGWAVAIPEGYEGQVRPRSGLALRHGVTVLNAPGTIDSGYRGELGVILVNHGHELFSYSAGDRIAQLVIAPVASVATVEGQGLPDTARGAGGFGSTGKG